MYDNDLFEATRNDLRELFPGIPEEELNENTRNWLRVAEMVLRHAEELASKKNYEVSPL